MLTGVESTEGLVQNQKIGLVDNRRDELHFLRHAFGKFVTSLALDARKADPLE